MNSAPQWLSTLWHWRLDAVFTAALVGMACLAYRCYLAQRRPAQPCSRPTWLGALALTSVGAVIAEWVTAPAGNLTAGDARPTIARLRVILFSGILAITIAVLGGSTVTALLRGDPLRIREVLVNLIDNAIKFTPRGSVTLFLTWSPPGPNATPGRPMVRGRDTGIGISAEKRKHLFQMFMQAEVSTTRRDGGTGPGLAICQRLIALMGGDIVVASTPGEGTEFSFTLPVTPVTRPAEAETTAAPIIAHRLRHQRHAGAMPRGRTG